MRRIGIIASALVLAACTTGGSAPPPPDKAAGFTIVREGDFARTAVKMVACTSQEASKQNIAHTFVVGDTATVAPSYPEAALGQPQADTEYVAMALASKSDTKPLWMVIGRDTAAGQSHVVLKTGVDAGGHPNADPSLWSLVTSCGAQQ